MVVDKPMTKVLPELYEENNEIPNIFKIYYIIQMKINLIKV